MRWWLLGHHCSYGALQFQLRFGDHMSVYKSSELEKALGFIGAQDELQRMTDRHLAKGGKVVRDIKFNASGKRYIERIKLSMV